MANFDPLIDLLPEDRAFLDLIHERFRKSRLAQVPGASLMGVLIGKLLAVAEKRGLDWRAVVVANLPTKIEVARRTWGLTPRDEEAIRFSEEHSAEYVTDLTDRMREQVQETVTQGLQEKLPPPQLAQRLLEEYGALNRDWRRVALTETATAVSNGYLAQQDPGELVVGDSAVDCCEWCAEHIQNRVFRLLPEPPAEPTEADSWECVWVGKTNVGRSKYRVKKDGTVRTSAEMWHPAIPAHPHCRCRWRKFVPGAEEIEPGTNRVVDKLNLFKG